MANLGRRPGAPRSLRRAALLCTFATVASVASAAALTAVTAEVGPARAAGIVDVVAWAPYWEYDDALASFGANSGQMAELTPFFWSATSANSIVRSSSITQAELAQYKAAAAVAGKPIVATIVDAMPARAMAGVLANPVDRALHVAAIVKLAVDEGFSGVDIDYEKFAFSDGKATWPTTFVNWGTFLTELSTALHLVGRTLAVAVPPIYNALNDDTSGYWVYNFPVMAQVVDRVRVMTYSYSVSRSGPIAPFNWVRDSIDDALAIVPASKLVLGIAAYGSDWVIKTEGSCPVGVNPVKRNIQTATATAWAASKGIKPGWDPVTRERTYSYVESFTGADGNGNTVRCNISRTAWYSDADAIYQRVKLAQDKGLAGVAIWALGYDDPITWQGIAAARAGDANWKAPELPTPPPVPAPGPPISSPTGPLPARFLDTRSGAKTTDGQFAGKGRLAAGAVLEVQIAGRGTVPADAAAVTLNVTVVGEGNGYVTVYPCGDRPTTSSLNVRSGQIISNSVITKLSDDGTVCLFTQAPAHLLVDVFNVLPASAFTPLDSPARLLDTRAGLATIDGQFAGGGAITAGSVLEIQVAGRGGMSPTARTAVLNVTSDGAVGAGFLAVWPCDSPPPSTSNVNYVASVPVPNAVVTGLSPRGTACVLSSNRTNVVIDAFGSLETERYEALAQPSRLLDTRVGGSTVDGVSSGGGAQPTGSVIELQVGGRGGVPVGASAVVLNVTVDGPTANGFITVYPCASSRPLVSNVNFAPGQTLPNLVVTSLSGAGTVCLFNLGATHVVVDVFGVLKI